MIRVIALLAACLFAGCAAKPPKDVTVVVAPVDLVCETDVDCELFSASCSGCDCGTPVRADRAAFYEQQQQDSCRAYRESDGPRTVCDCPNNTKLCRNGTCAAADPELLRIERAMQSSD